jgi:integrase
MSPHTRRAYAGQWRLWAAFCATTGATPLPAAPAVVANWIAARANSGLRSGRRARIQDLGQSLATLRSAVSALRAAHIAAGLEFNSRHPAIHLVLKGIARKKADLPRQAAPLRAETVAAILANLDKTPLDLRDGALIALGYCFARRRSELAGLDYQRLGSGDGVLIVTSKHLIVHLAVSKAGQVGEPEIYVVPSAENTGAVRALERWLVLAGIKPGEPILRRVHKSGRVGSDRIDPQTISLVLKRRIIEYLQRTGESERAALEQARSYSGHSLRIGFAVTSAEAGADIGAIQRALGHRTPLMSSRYAKVASLVATTPHQLPGVGVRKNPSPSKLSRSGRS